MVIVKRVLKGTSFEVTVELDKVQYAHFQLVTREKPGLHMPLDQNVAGKMKVLADHFEKPGPGLREMAAFIEDEARDVAEMTGGYCRV